MSKPDAVKLMTDAEVKQTLQLAEEVDQGRMMKLYPETVQRLCARALASLTAPSVAGEVEARIAVLEKRLRLEAGMWWDCQTAHDMSRENYIAFVLREKKDTLEAPLSRGEQIRALASAPPSAEVEIVCADGPLPPSDLAELKKYKEFRRIRALAEGIERAKHPAPEGREDEICSPDPQPDAAKLVEALKETHLLLQVNGGTAPWYTKDYFDRNIAALRAAGAL